VANAAASICPLGCVYKYSRCGPGCLATFLGASKPPSVPFFKMLQPSRLQLLGMNGVKQGGCFMVRIPARKELLLAFIPGRIGFPGEQMKS
jgi:hypothetical protein